MVKKKKPKLLDELEKIIINKHHLINIPTNDKILELNTFKYGSDFDVNVHKCDNIIPNINIIKFDKNEPTKDNMFKTFKYTLNPDKSQFKLLLGFCDAYIEMYNLTIKKIKEERKIQRNIQNKNIKYCEMNYIPNVGILKKYFVNDKENLSKKYKINKHTLDYAINDVITMFKSIVTNQRNGHVKNSKMRYLKKSKNSKIFKVEKNSCTNESFFSSILGKKLSITPFINYKNECETVYIVQFNKKENKFFLLKKVKIIETSKNKVNNSISIDLGVRTIITGISENHILEIGKNVSEKIKKKINKIQILTKINKKRKINKIEKSITNYVNDFQWKTSNYLVSNYEHIVVGNFSTNSMKKKYNNDTNLEVMKCLNMFNFRQKIKYKCLKHKKKYIKVNEAYTTKLCVNCSYYNDIGSSKIYKCSNCNKTYDRDIKSAGCIYLKALQ